MKKIFTGIDIGTDSIKMAVCEFIDQKMYVLASSSVRTVGMKKGLIQDPQMVAHSLSLAKQELEESLGISITTALVNMPLHHATLSIVTGEIAFDEEKTIDGEDIVLVLREALFEERSKEMERVTVVPICFRVNEEEYKDPKGLVANSLGVKAVVSSIPKEDFYSVVEAMKLAGMKIFDATFTTIGDYYEMQKKDYDQKVGAVINIGSETTSVSILNKGIAIKHSVISIGSKHVDHDIAYIYKLDMTSARQLKENFAVASGNYADYNDILEIQSERLENLVLNQGEISEVIESRLKEILKLAKIEINRLTNREISYIIVTGGISELMGFQYLINDLLGKYAVTLNMTTIGARSSKFGSVLGMLRYLDDKLTIRGQEETMITESVGETGIKKKSSSVASAIFDRLSSHL